MFARQALPRRQPRRQPALSTVAAVAAASAGAYVIYGYLNNNVAAESTDAPKTFSGGFGFTSLRLHSVESVNHNTKRLRFELPHQNAVSGLSLTSSLLSISRSQGRWLPVLRPYTPVSDLDEPGFIEFLVKRYPNGKASSHLHSMTPGESLSFTGPLKGYPWTLNKHSHITLIAGGAGITPAYQLIRGILDNPQEQTKITLVFGVNTDADVLLRQEFEQFEKMFPGRFKAFYTVSNPVDGSPFHKGYVSKELLQKVMPAPQAQNIKVFLCGPPGMEAAILGRKGWFGGRQGGVLEQLGYSKDQVYQF